MSSRSCSDKFFLGSPCGGNNLCEKTIWIEEDPNENIASHRAESTQRIPRPPPEPQDAEEELTSAEAITAYFNANFDENKFGNLLNDDLNKFGNLLNIRLTQLTHDVLADFAMVLQGQSTISTGSIAEKVLTTPASLQKAYHTSLFDGVKSNSVGESAVGAAGKDAIPSHSLASGEIARQNMAIGELVPMLNSGKEVSITSNPFGSSVSSAVDSALYCDSMNRQISGERLEDERKPAGQQFARQSLGQLAQQSDDACQAQNRLSESGMNDVIRTRSRKSSMVRTSSKMSKLKKSLDMEEEAREGGSDKPRRSLSATLLELDTQKKDTCLDIVMAVIIFANSIIIGVSMDHQIAVIEVINVGVTVCFLIELACKFMLNGFLTHFSQFSNQLDFMLVVLDLLQISLELADVDSLEQTPTASLFRVVRLLRLVRLIRLVRLKILDDLVAMISGMIGGMSTLFWAIVLLLIFLYITSLMFREFFGAELQIVEGEDITEYFSSVPRAMFTVFRYFFGDFQTITGTNLFEAIQLVYGTPFGIFVSLLFFVVTVGLFNVIAAIFVESTLAAANALQKARKTERLNDNLLWSTRISVLVQKLFEYDGIELSESLSESLDAVGSKSIPEVVFQDFIKDEIVVKALNDLEIDEADHKYLFDILDNDNTGSISVSQLSDGVERLRGDPRRSDIITVDLMVRAIQEQTNFLVVGMETCLEVLNGISQLPANGKRSSQ